MNQVDNQVDELLKLIDASVKTFYRFYSRRSRFFSEKYYSYIKLISCSQYKCYRYDL